MGLMAKETGGDFKAVDAGTYVARCFGIVDLGTKDNEWQGQVKKRHQILIQWELPTELIEDGELAGKPYSVSEFYTLSLGEKANLRHALESWRGREFTAEELKGFDLNNLLGKPCMISVIHNDKGKAKVSTVSKLMKGLEVPPQINPSRFFSLEVWDQKGFDGLTDGLKKMVMESDEYSYIKKTLTALADPLDAPFTQADQGEDEIPF